MKTMTKTVPDAMPENITNDDTRVITEAMMGVGDCYPQGDLYFVRLAKLPKSAKPREGRQLADGTTQGSRHVCEVGDVYQCDATEIAAAIKATNGAEVAPRYLGLVFATVDGHASVTHPEHGNHDYRMDGCFAVVVQRTLTADQREARAAD